MSRSLPAYRSPSSPETTDSGHPSPAEPLHRRHLQSHQSHPLRHNQHDDDSCQELLREQYRRHHESQLASSSILLPAPQGISLGEHHNTSTQSTSLFDVYVHSPGLQFSFPGGAAQAIAEAACKIRRSLIPEVNRVLHPDRVGQTSPNGVGEIAIGGVADWEGDTDPVLRVMHQCIDIFFQYFFPNTPIAHEPSLRLAVTQLAAGLYPLPLTDASETDQLASIRSSAMVTALCAFVTSVVPESALVYSTSLTWPFYLASRAMLRLCEELDLDSPLASSYTSRMWQASALQNLTGKNSLTWHISGEVIVMALRTRLYEENTLGQSQSLDAQLLRANFWVIQSSDRAAVALDDRPSLMSDLLTHDLLTLQERPERSEPLLDPSRPVNTRSFEEMLIEGFHLKRRIWDKAADFMHHLKIFCKHYLPAQTQSLVALPDWGQLVDAHVAYTGTLDEMPACLRSPNGACSGPGSDPVAEYQASSFWALRNGTVSVYHCMRLVMLHECIQRGIPEVLGLENQGRTLAARKLEIVQEFLFEMQLVPFMCLKVQGEAAVC